MENKPVETSPSAKNMPKESPLKPFEDAYNEYFRVLQETWSSAQKQCDEIYRTYTLGFRTGQRSPHEVLGEANRSLANLHQTVSSRAEDAYRSYLRTLQSSWSKANLESLDVCSLVILSRSMYEVAARANGYWGPL